jgi:hypothetical protein
MKYQLHLDTSVSSNVQTSGMPIVSKINGNPFLSSILLYNNHKNVNTVELKSAEIPIGFYNIRPPYNTFIINGITYTIPPGNYTITTLIAAMNTATALTNIFRLDGNFIQFAIPGINLPFTFTNMGATGSTGPTTITYGTNTPGYGTGSVLTLTGGIQYWTVPLTRTYTFTVAGAGSFHTASLNSVKVGYGIVLNASYTLTQGQIIAILVGQLGLFNADGGGGTFVASVTGAGVLNTAVPLFVAGGAGGPGGESSTGSNGNINGTLSTKGQDGKVGAPSRGGAGGVGPAGGNAPTDLLYSYADGGAGFSGDGGWYTNSGSVLNVPKSFVNGGKGGTNTGRGGFGGGAGYGSYQDREGGGGGGYGGGGSGGSNGSGAGGGGGGSYDITGAYSGSTTNTGMGYVIVN